jgi:hypothetical protein
LATFLIIAAADLMAKTTTIKTTANEIMGRK